MWQYITRVEIESIKGGLVSTRWVPITWRGRAGRIDTRDAITAGALTRGQTFVDQINVSPTEGGRSNSLTGNVQIIAVVWIPA